MAITMEACKKILEDRNPVFKIGNLSSWFLRSLIILIFNISWLVVSINNKQQWIEQLKFTLLFTYSATWDFVNDSLYRNFKF